MDTNWEFFQRAILAVFSVFILSKVIAYALAALRDNFLSSGRKEQEDLDSRIEIMVERLKKQGFGSGHETANKGKGPSGTLDRHALLFAEKLNQAKEKYGETGKTYLDLKEIMNIYENAKWGSGPVFHHLSQTMAKNLKIPESYFDISQSAIELIRENTFEYEGNHLPYADCLDLIKSKVTLDLLFQDARGKGDKIFSVLAEQYSLEVSQAMGAFELFFGKNMGKSEEDLLKLATQKEDSVKVLAHLDPLQRKKAYKNILFSRPMPVGGRVVHFTHILHQIKKYAQITEKIQGLYSEDLSQDQLKEAFEKLGCHPGQSEHEVKAAFNKLAKRHHPDKMSLMTLSPEKLKSVNEQFSQIKISYDLIRVWMKKRKKLLEILRE